MLQTNVCYGQEVASFYRCLALACLWKVKFWRSFIKCQYCNDGWTDFHKNIYLYLGLFFVDRKNSGLTPGQNDDPDVKDDPSTRWPSSMFEVDYRQSAVELCDDTIWTVAYINMRWKMTVSQLTVAHGSRQQKKWKQYPLRKSQLPEVCRVSPGHTNLWCILAPTTV